MERLIFYICSWKLFFWSTLQPFEFYLQKLYTLKMTLDIIQQKVRPILEKYGVEYAGVFGSVARGDAKETSDIDILVKFKGPATFQAYLELDENLRHVLGRDIDLLTEGGVNKFIRPAIEKDLKLIYGQR